MLLNLYRDTLQLTIYTKSHQLFIAGQFPKLFSSNNSTGSSLTVADENVLFIRVNNRNLFTNLPDSMREQWVFMVDGKGAPVYSNQLLDVPTVELLDVIRESPEGDTMINGMEMLLIKKNIAKTDWTLYSLVHYKDIVQNSGSIVRATLIIAGICVLLLVVILC